MYERDDAHLAELLNDSRVLARLVEDLRTLANAESGVLRLQKEPTDLSLLIHDAARMAAPEAAVCGVVLDLEDADLPIVEVDPLRIREVLTNLLANAIRHTNRGGSVTIAARVDDESVTIGVRDTGAGIAPEEVPKIFDRFYKGATSTGSGLGLTIARGLVAAHGGEIHAESTVGVGTTVTFRLPRTTGPSVTDVDRAGPRRDRRQADRSSLYTPRNSIPRQQRFRRCRPVLEIAPQN